MISVQMIEDWKTTFYQWSVGLSWNYLTQLKSWDWKILWMSSSLGKKGRSFIASLWSLRIQRNAGSYFANSLIHSIEILTKTIQLLCLLFYSDHGMNLIDKEREGAISLWQDCDRNKTSFMYSYGPLGLVEPLPEYKQEVYQQLKSRLRSMHFQSRKWNK